MGLANVSEESVYTVGGSMEVTLQYNYACFMGLKGAIVANPQLDYISARAHVIKIGRGQLEVLAVSGG